MTITIQANNIKPNQTPIPTHGSLKAAYNQILAKQITISESEDISTLYSGDVKVPLEYFSLISRPLLVPYTVDSGFSLYLVCTFYFILFYFILFYFILFYFILLYGILFYCILLYCILFYFILFYFILFYSILFYFILFSLVHTPLLVQLIWHTQNTTHYLSLLTLYGFALSNHLLPILNRFSILLPFLILIYHLVEWRKIYTTTV